MKGGLEGLSPHPTALPLTPRDVEDPRPPPAPGVRGWPLERGPCWAEFCVLEKEVPSQTWGCQGPRPQCGGGCGEVPPLQSPAAPGKGTNPALIAHRRLLHAAHVCTRVPALGGRRGESPKKQQRERGGPAGGCVPCWRGAGRSGRT